MFSEKLCDSSAFVSWKIVPYTEKSFEGDNASETLIVKAFKPLNLKKDRALLTGLLTHKIVRARFEADSRAVATLFY
jgi:hypothetical protein